MLLLFVVACMPPVMAENRYVNNNPAIYEVLPSNAYGYVVFYIRGVTVQDNVIFISSDDRQKDIVMDNTFRSDRTNITGQNKEMLKVETLPNGVSEPFMLAAGNYTAHLRQGNGDQPETQKFVIGGGATERVVFLGAAVPTVHKLTCMNFTVLDVPGAIIHHDEVNHTVHHEAVTREVIVVDVPAWDEFVYHDEVNHTVHHGEISHVVYHDEVNHTVYHEAVTHTVYHEAVTHTVYHDEVNHTVHHNEVSHIEYRFPTNYFHIHDWKWFWEGWKVKCTNHAEHGEGWHFETPACNGPSTWSPWQLSNPHEHDQETRTVVDSPAWDEIIVDTPAYEELVVDTPAWEEVVIDTPAYEELVVDTPAYKETIIDVAGWDEIIVDSPAWVETIHHPAETHTEIETLVPAYDEIVVDSPAWDEPIDPVTHEVTVCDRYGSPAAPVGTIQS